MVPKYSDQNSNQNSIHKSSLPTDLPAKLISKNPETIALIIDKAEVNIHEDKKIPFEKINSNKRNI